MPSLPALGAEERGAQRRFALSPGENTKTPQPRKVAKVDFRSIVTLRLHPQQNQVRKDCAAGHHWCQHQSHR